MWKYLMTTVLASSVAAGFIFGGDDATLDDRIKNAPPDERAMLKGVEIADALNAAPDKADVARSEYRFEITDIVPTAEGIEVFARVRTPDGKQYGFGPDGDVDIERFRFVNPPVLVEDSAGPIVRTWVNAYGVTMERRLRADPKEAILQALEGTLNEKTEKKLDTEIKAEKVGRTTTTIYPNPATSIDGYSNFSAGATWAAAHDALAGTGASDTITEARAIETHFLGGVYYITRGFFLFDTSVIPDTDVISSATLSLYTGPTGIADNDGASVDVVASTPASDTAITVLDYDQVGTTVFSTLDMGSLSLGAYNALAFNASGIAAITKTGVSKFATRSSKDTSNTAPAFESSWFVFYADETGTATDPKLVIEHAAANTFNPAFMFPY